jgi:hypothetical protein
MDRKTLIQQTISAVQDALMNLEMERDRIGYELNEKTELLKVWQRELTQLEKGNTDPNRQRAPKGEALRLIHEWYDKDLRSQQAGLTIKQIAEATGLKWSTVRNVVKKVQNGFVEQDSRIRRLPEIDRQRRLKVAS